MNLEMYFIEFFKKAAGYGRNSSNGRMYQYAVCVDGRRAPGAKNFPDAYTKSSSADNLEAHLFP